MKNIGHELKKIMNDKNLKQKEVAIKLNMTAVNLSKILRKDSIDAALLEKIAEVLNIPVSFFFNYSSEETIKKVEESAAHYVKKSDIKCYNCESLEKIIEYQNRHIDRLESELEKYRQKNVS